MDAGESQMHVMIAIEHLASARIELTKADNESLDSALRNIDEAMYNVVIRVRQI